MAKKRRPCPRGLYDGCPIPRELCLEDFERTGSWHCMKLLGDFEGMLFGIEEAEPVEELRGEGIVSLEELMRVLGEMDA